jgi:uncharacterized glyoxalase superfamily protein PhnB
MSATKPVPEGFHTITPHMVVRNAGAAIEFYKKAFAAEEIARMPGPDGKGVMHAELKIGNSMVMLCDEMEHCKSPQSLSGTPVTIHLYVEDVDAVYNRAIQAGARSTMPVMDSFWGDRYGKLQDPYGHDWSVATHKQDLAPEEIHKAAAEFFTTGGCNQPAT